MRVEEKILRMHFAQLQKAWAISLNNQYSDARKKEHQVLISNIISIVETKLTAGTKVLIGEIFLLKALIDLAFKNIDYLDSSTLNLLPFELIKCIETALKEWTSEDENPLVITKESHGMHIFTFDNSLLDNKQVETALRYFQSNIEYNEYGVVMINYPKYLKSDYLACAVLYHELGHYIDYKFLVSYTVFDEIIDLIERKRVDIKLKDQLPVLKDRKLTEEFVSLFRKTSKRDVRLLRPIMEYFADIFASQYTGDSLINYMEYMDEYEDSDLSLYPTVSNRSKLIRSFLAGENHGLIKFFKQIIQKSASKNINRKETLKIRFTPLDKNVFIDLMPCKINTDSELHGLMKQGWDLWKGDYKQIEHQNNFKFSLSDKQAYELINNLIEKSISNYIVEKTWSSIT